jgi:hypothetical protein
MLSAPSGKNAACLPGAGSTRNGHVCLVAVMGVLSERFDSCPVIDPLVDACDVGLFPVARD